ncbi:hypothetical protein EXIGLDRAFT_767053 [Exidia glandulosa HHB12029]|uniref:F-box domain-containing protein n=1 Tax=Exidia glandulosa HHB12029 TaxID=1314781 RepID=A0A165J9E8_EXIGL|nr:hypothetical protein EXIGLDRAFT_767053 [Exidia glandulosa HHB12029]
MSAHPLFHPDQHHPGRANRSEGLNLARSRMASSDIDVLGVVHAPGPDRVASYFAAMPFELVVLVITGAARDCAHYSTRWVASLTLVCRVIHHAVDSILVETLRVTGTNCEAVVMHQTRFEQTQHINVVSCDWRIRKCMEVLLWHRCSSLKAVTFSNCSPEFSNSVLLMLRDRHRRIFDTVSHLHIRHLIARADAKALPASVTHLALDPAISGPRRLLLFVHYVSRYLDERSHHLERLLVRTAHASADFRAAFIDAVTGIALERQDTRVWVDDNRRLTSYESKRKAAMDDEELGIALWYTGRQLYVPS